MRRPIAKKPGRGRTFIGRLLIESAAGAREAIWIYREGGRVDMTRMTSDGRELRRYAPPVTADGNGNGDWFAAARATWGDIVSATFESGSDIQTRLHEARRAGRDPKA